MTKEQIEAERVKFEAWATQKGCSPEEVSDVFNSDCYLSYIQAYWEAWQARAALDPINCAPRGEVERKE